MGKNCARFLAVLRGRTCVFRQGMGRIFTPCSFLASFKALDAPVEIENHERAIIIH